MTLSEALSIAPGDVVAFVGAGGKTTAMFRCARDLAHDGQPAVITTTTKIFVPDPTPDLALVVDGPREETMTRTKQAAAAGKIAVVGATTIGDRKLAGVPASWVAELASLPSIACVLVEADGAARHAITAPREDEPVIPQCTTLVVAVVGIDALGGVIEHVAHRPEHVSDITGLPRSAMLDAKAIAHVLLDPRGNTKGAPAGARVVVIVNKADDDRALASARAVAIAVREMRDVRVVIGSLEHDGVREVIG